MAKKAATAKTDGAKTDGAKTDGAKGEGSKAAASKASASKASASKVSATKPTATKAAVSKKTGSKSALSKATEAKAIVSDAEGSKPSKSAAAKDSGSAKAAAGKAPVLLTLTDIGDHLASTFDMPKSHAKIYLAEAVALIGKNLKKGNKVRISGLGVFQVKKRAPRKGRNPTTGEAIKIKATKRVGFAVARDLKAKL